MRRSVFKASSDLINHIKFNNGEHLGVMKRDTHVTLL